MNQRHDVGDPISSQSRTARTVAAPGPNRRRALLPVLWLALATPGLGAAGPALEYGPEVEASFLDRCGRSGATAVSCRRLMEQLQAQLGYAAFIELAAGGPEGFGRVAGDRIATAAPSSDVAR